MKFFITKHCQQRYIERVNNGLNVDDNVLFTILNKVSAGKDITNKIYDEIPRFILYLYEKYGELGQTIIKSDNIIFITKKRVGTNNLFDAITCYFDNNYLSQYKNTVLSREDIFIKIKEAKKKAKYAKI